MELIKVFEDNKEKFTPKDIKIRDKIPEENIKGENKDSKGIIKDDGTIKIKEERFTFKGPFVLRMKVLKEGNYRLEGVLYHLIPGDYFEGANLSQRKRDILTNTKHIIME
jgi:hypothetical protein